MIDVLKMSYIKKSVSAENENKKDTSSLKKDSSKQAFEVTTLNPHHYPHRSPF